jgi:hypothetical protein
MPAVSIIKIAAKNCFFDVPLVDLKLLAGHLDVHLPSSATLYTTVEALLHKMLPAATEEEVFAIMEKRVKPNDFYENELLNMPEARLLGCCLLRRALVVFGMFEACMPGFCWTFVLSWCKHVNYLRLSVYEKQCHVRRSRVLAIGENGTPL